MAARAAAFAVLLATGSAWAADEAVPLPHGWIGTTSEWVHGFGIAFALLQAAVLRWLGLAAAALLGPFYLIAPAVAGLPPELINPTYRALLWSWTPFRFSAEGMRSMLFLGGGAPDVQPALLLMFAIALGGAILVVARRKSPAVRT